MWYFESHKVQVPLITRTRSLTGRSYVVTVSLVPSGLVADTLHITSPLFYLHQHDRFEMETIRHQDAHESGKPGKKPRSTEAFLAIADKEVNPLKRVPTMTVVTVHYPGADRTCGRCTEILLIRVNAKVQVSICPRQAILLSNVTLHLPCAYEGDSLKGVHPLATLSEVRGTINYRQIDNTLLKNEFYLT